MDPEDDGPAPSARVAILRRRSTRRAILAAAASVAAAGTAAAVVGVAAQGNDKRAVAPGVVSDSVPTQGPAPTSAVLAAKQVSDPLKRAAHLLRRAGFGGSMAEVEAFARLSQDEAADRLLNFAAADNSALEARLRAANFELNDYGNGLLSDMQRWWFTRMVYSARPLEERMTFTWHGLLTSQLSKIGRNRAKLMVKQNELFRTMALPRYGALLQAISKDPAMLVYLDNVESVKDHPNENYARELMELFSMGVGSYTEEDVRESARAFTGWRITQPVRGRPTGTLTAVEQQEQLRRTFAAWQPEFQFVARQHDAGRKTFLGKTGAWDGGDIVDIIMEQEATARFVTTRLFEEFAYPGPSAAVIDRLVNVWKSNGADIRAVLRAILVSDEFSSEQAYRSKVRSPVEFIVGLVRGLELESTFTALGANGGRGAYSPYRAMDQVLFEPPSVAGWPGGPAWISSSTFFARANFLDQLFWPRNGRPAEIPALRGLTSAEDLVDGAAARLVDGDITAAGREAIAAHASTVRDPAERAATVAYLVAASPEYQLI